VAEERSRREEEARRLEAEQAQERAQARRREREEAERAQRQVPHLCAGDTRGCVGDTAWGASHR
jgi:hypothetical protein